MKRLSVEECNELFRKFNTPDNVIGHCREVSRVAAGIAEELNKAGYNMDVDLVRGAGLAHDVARTFDEHWNVGADALEELGYQDEADIVRVHMMYQFNSFEDLNETDMVCMGDRLVKDDHYVGLDERIDYIIHKAGDIPEVTARILEKKEQTRKLIRKIEERTGQTMDELFMKG